MPPIGETTPASETERAPLDAGAAPATAPPVDAPPTRDFVGWTMQAEFRSGRKLSAEVTRKVLATALGLSQDFHIRSLQPVRRYHAGERPRS